jgi:hypothetical protein
LRGVLIFCREDPRKKRRSAIGSLAGFEPRDSNGGDQILVRRITSGEGKVGEKVQEADAVRS